MDLFISRVEREKDLMKMEDEVEAVEIMKKCRVLDFYIFIFQLYYIGNSAFEPKRSDHTVLFFAFFHLHLFSR